MIEMRTGYLGWHQIATENDWTNYPTSHHEELSPYQVDQECKAGVYSMRTKTCQHEKEAGKHIEGEHIMIQVFK